MLFDLLKAAGLGIVEGLTEYIPVSSTGHLLLLEHFFGFSDEGFGNTFAVLIQLGAILALLAIYFAKLWTIATGLLTDSKARLFVIGVLVAFLPAAVVGASLHGFIKNVLFNPWIVCVSLVIGGAVLLYIDSLDLQPRYRDATSFSLPMYLGIGICQCLAMIPGVSRSGATIVSAMLLGADRRSA
ncbi:MAG: undecaprenyl-diphosphate phosphatase, partial [Bradyrhizobiaceae bacterium]|nr:undecaprenyl-diphosphate phosphatase [Bradyrhizobiaceae bacterium]